MPDMRPMASDITDDQLDALWAGLDLVEERHRPKDYDFTDAGAVQEVGYCIECGRPSPCPTIRIISRQRSIATESLCPKDGTDRSG
jgi:hypothetical protein